MDSCVSHDVTFSEAEAGLTDFDVPVPEGTWLFHRDSAGKASFNEVEARAASELIAAMRLDERIMAEMGKNGTPLSGSPQEHPSPTAYACSVDDAHGAYELFQVMHHSGASSHP